VDPDALPRVGSPALERLRQNEIAQRFLTDEFLEENVRQTLELDEVAGRMSNVISAQQLMKAATFDRVDCVSAVRDELLEYHHAVKDLQRLLPPRDGAGFIERLRHEIVRRAHRGGFEEVLSQAWQRCQNAERALSRTAIERYIRPLILETIAAREESSSEVLLLPELTAGLSRHGADEFILETSTGRRIDATLRNSHSASVGLAGPRGSGKSTILEAFCSGTGRSAEGLTIRADAPVVFDARDYFLSIFSRVCEAVISETEILGDAVPPTPSRLPSVVTLTSRMRRARAVASVTGLIAAASLAVAGGVVITEGGRYTSSWIPHADAALLGYWILVGGILLLGLVPAVQLRSTGALSDWFVGSVQKRKPARPVMIGGVLCALISFELWRAAFTDGLAGRMLYLPAVVVVGLLLLSWCAIHILSRQLDNLQFLRARMAPARSESELLGTRALNYMHEIKYQQSHSSTSSGRVASGGGGLVSLELSSQRQASAARLPWTLPETVGELRKFLSELGASRRVVIGIDELDKISSSSAAIEFVDSIKALFGLPGVYFIVSVSVDAIISFERKGLPFKDSFNSAFDDVHRVPHLEQEQTVSLLRARVMDMPFAFAEVCHAASGGLPRDSIRYASKMYALADERSPSALGLVEACRALGAEEIEAALNAIGVEVAKFDADPYVRQTLLVFGEATAATAIDSLVTHVERLNELSGQCRSDSAVDADVKQSLVRMVAEATALLAFWVTVIELARRVVGGDRTVARGGFAALAHMRRAMHPTLALEQIAAIRRVCGLRVLQ
jgi:hypothetical protein